MSRWLEVSAIAVLLVLLCVPASGQSIYTVAGAGETDGKPATKVGFVNPQDAAVDSQGRVYFAVEGRVRVVDPDTGIIQTAAGTGAIGNTGDGGPAREAQLSYPSSIHIDPSDRLYISQGNRIRIVDLETGIISSLPTIDGDFADGPMEEATLGNVEDLTSDDSGNVYFVDSGFRRVRKIDWQAVTITTVAGTGAEGYSGDDGPALDATFRFPSGIAWHDGTLYVADGGANVVRAIDLGNETIRRYAGNGTRGFSGDGGPAIEAQLAASFPEENEGRTIWMDVDSTGNLYIGDFANGRVRRVTADGIIDTFIGGGTEGVSEVPRPPDSLELCCPAGIAWDPNGILYTVDMFGWAVVRTSLNTNLSRLFAGGNPAHFGDGGPAYSSGISFAVEVAWDRQNRIFLSDGFSGLIRRIDLNSGLIEAFAGGGDQITGPASDVALFASGLTVAPDGKVYWVDETAEMIRAVTTGSRIVTTIAGNGERGDSPDGVLATEAPLKLGVQGNVVPIGIVVDTPGNVYFTEMGAYRVRVVEQNTGLLKTVAGDGQALSQGDGGPATEASINRPSRLALDPTERFLYIGEGAVFEDEGDSSGGVRRVDLSTGIITTVAGNGTGWCGEDNLPATSLALGAPFGLGVDPAGDLLILAACDGVLKVDVESGILTRVAGSIEDVPYGDNGPALSASLRGLYGLGVNPLNGDIAVADAGANRVRVIPACRDSLTTPSLTFPSNGSSGIGTAPTLSWSEVDGAFTYDLYLDTGNASTLVLSDASNTSYTLSNLTPGTVYNWKVVAKGDPYCPEFVTSTSSTFTFTTAGGCTAPGSFSLTAPTAGAAVSGTSTTLSWANASGASAYDVYFGTNNPPPLVGSTASTTFNASNLLTGATYHWKIVAHATCDASRTTSSETRSFTVSGGGTCNPPSDFTLTAPTNGATDLDLSVNLQWNASANATSYDLFFGTTSPPPIYLPDVSSTSQTISSLQGGVTYYWNVRARTGCSTSSFTTPISSFSTQSICTVPGQPAILFSPPGSVTAGQTYVIVWNNATALAPDGLYQVERSSSPSFATLLDSQLVQATSASFVANQPGTYYHRVRAVPVCDVTKAGIYSETTTVTVASGDPNVVFTVHPPAIISNLGQALEDKRASFTIENISDETVQVIMTTARIASPDFFSVYDPQGSDGVFVDLEPRVPHTFDLRFSGPPNDQAGSYQGVIVINVPGSPVIPYAFVNLKVGSQGSAAPEIIVGDTTASYVAFPGFSGSDDNARPTISVFVRNPGSTPMEVGAEIGPEAWLVPESDWNTQPIQPGALRELKLRTNRKRAPNGSPLPRYTYLTIRTRTGESARILVQDNDLPAAGEERTRLAPEDPSYLVPDVLADHTRAGLISVVRLTNVGDEVVQSTLYFTPRGSDGFSGDVKKATVLVPGNDVVVLTDPIGQLFGITGDAFGQIEVRAPRAKIGLLSVASTIVDHMQAELVVASIPTVWRGEGARLGATLLVPGVTNDSGQISELILIETLGTDRSSVQATLYDNAGTLLGQRTLNVPRYGQTSISDIAAGFAGGAVLTAARLEIAPSSGGGAIVPMVKIADRVTRATAVLVGQPKGGGSSAKRAAIAQLHGRKVQSARTPSVHEPVEYVIPFTASGAWGSSSSTSTLLGLSSSLAAPVNIFLTFRNSVTGQTSNTSVTLPGGASREFLDVLAEIFGFSAGIRGTLTVTADPNVRVYSRALAAPVGSGAAGTSGQNAVIPLDSLLLSGASANYRRLLFLDGINQSIDEGRGSRWSVLVSELTGQSATITVRLYEAGNRRFPIVSKDFTLPGFSVLPLDTLFQKMDLNTASRRKNRANMICVIEPRLGVGVITAVAVEQSNVTGSLRTHSFLPVAGTPATGTTLATGNAAPEPPSGRKRPIRR